jgi:hypothetical protein
MVLTKGSKQRLKEFDKYVRLRRAYILKLLTRYSKVYKGDGTMYKNKLKANNAMHSNILNNLRKPKSQRWKKVRGIWQCDGCRL